MTLLSHPSIRDNPHIVQLIGLCCDIPDDDHVWPVLVFEKTHLGDMYRFMTSGKGTALSINERFNLCVDVGLAVSDMHHNRKAIWRTEPNVIANRKLDVIHGDLKPHNVLIFQDASGNYIARVGDFGYSSHFQGQDDIVFLPRSVPWAAPEWHHRWFTAMDAKKMDVYSFGLVCLWLILGPGPDGYKTKPSTLEVWQGERLMLEIFEGWKW
jgi:serine/threonine protein kinase